MGPVLFDCVARWFQVRGYGVRLVNNITDIDDKIIHRSLETGEPYEMEYRLLHHTGDYVWTLSRAMPIRNAAGVVTRWFGTGTDIAEMKRLELSKALLSQELSHRIKNIFAVISALLALSARQYPEARAFATAARSRIAALARAHEFVRPQTESARPSRDGTTLHAFLRDLFLPYDDEAAHPRVVVSGDDADFDDQAATPVALLFHELATNAAKYGALSVPGGRVSLTTLQQGERYAMTWQERGGPPLCMGEKPMRLVLGAGGAKPLVRTRACALPPPLPPALGGFAPSPF
jgi:two-component sensor histidine kinase